MSTRRGLPSQGSRGSFHGLADGAGPVSADTGPACCSAVTAAAGASPAVGSSLTELRYPRALLITNASHPAEAPMSDQAGLAAPATAARMAAAARALRAAGSGGER